MADADRPDRPLRPGGEPVGYSIIFQFLTDDPNYALGFELGVLYQQLSEGHARVTGVVHQRNDEQIIVMAGNLGYRYEAERMEHGWMRVTLTKR